MSKDIHWLSGFNSANPRGESFPGTRLTTPPYYANSKRAWTA